MAAEDVTSQQGARDLYLLLSMDSPAAAPTAADGSTVDNTYGQEENDVISNLVVRQAEIIACLQGANLMS